MGPCSGCWGAVVDDGISACASIIVSAFGTIKLNLSLAFWRSSHSDILKDTNQKWMNSGNSTDLDGVDDAAWSHREYTNTTERSSVHVPTSHCGIENIDNLVTTARYNLTSQSRYRIILVLLNRFLFKISFEKSANIPVANEFACGPPNTTRPHAL